MLLQHYGGMAQDWIARDPTAHLRYGLLLSVALVSAPLLALASYLWRVGARTIRAERFPPPGFAVVRNTRVLRGQSARRRGRPAQALAAATGSLACAFPVVCWRLAETLEPMLSTAGG